VARLVFLGTPPAAAVALDALVRAGHDVALVVSRADTRRGRGVAHTPSPTKAVASDHGLEVTDRLEDVAAVRAELGVVVAYGRIIPRGILQALPMVNVHFSLLPRWRGAAPVERAVLAGDSETGVCVMALEETLDTGPVLASQRVVIAEHEHASMLTSRLAALGAQLLVDTLAPGTGALPAGSPQEGEPTYAEKVRPDELRLDWARPAEHLERVVRLDRAWTTFRGERLLVLDAVARSAPDPFEALAPSDEPAPSDEQFGAVTGPGAAGGPWVHTAEGVLELLDVQPAGKRRMPASAWWRGVRVAPGERFGSQELRR